MLSKAIIFVFSFFGLFAIIMVTMPTEFYNAQAEYNRQDQVVADKFSAANLTVYANSGSHNMTFPYSSMDDGPSPPNWETGITSEYLEVWWANYPYGPYFVFEKSLQFRHTKEVWWGRDTHIMTIYERNGVNRISGPSNMLLKTTLEENYYDDINATVVVVKCEHLISTVMIQYNQSKYSSIGNAYDNGELGYLLTYEIDWNATGVSAWTLIGQLLSFQAPNFGVGGVGGTILNACVALPFYAIIAYLFYKLITGIVPFLSGGGGD